jgi:hypothetical protein
MRAKCLVDNAGSFPAERFVGGLSRDSEFNLRIGEEYSVYGIGLWDGLLSFLIVGERSEVPLWYPAEAFALTENSIPKNWYLAKFDHDDKNGLQLIMGYDEIVNSIDVHHDALLDDREVNALRVFFGRKDEMDSAD